METWPQTDPYSSHPPPGGGSETATLANGPGRRPLFQQIGWRRASPDERRSWLIQGAVILAAVLVIGSLMLLALR